MNNWLGQVTTGHGAMIVGPTVLAVLSGQMTWTTATPLLVAGAVGLLWPENTALPAQAQTATADLETLVKSVIAAGKPGPVPTAPVAAAPSA